MTALLICMISGALTGLASSVSALTNNPYFSGGGFEFENFQFRFNIGSSFFGLVAFLLTGPLAYGVAKQFLRGARTGEQMSIAGVFDGFKDDFGGAFLLNLMLGIFVFLWSLLFVIPGVVMGYAYSFAFYVKADHPEYGWRQCLDESKRLTNGHKGDLFVLELSFIGWYLVGALAFGVGTLWVVPYAEMTKTLYYLEISARANAAAGAYPPPPYGGMPQQPYGAAPQYPQQPYPQAQQGPQAPQQHTPYPQQYPQQTGFSQQQVPQTAQQQPPQPYAPYPQQPQPVQQPTYQPPQEPAAPPANDPGDGFRAQQ